MHEIMKLNRSKSACRIHWNTCTCTVLLARSSPVSLYMYYHPITKSNPIPPPPPTPKRYTNFVECEKCGLGQAWAPCPDL